MTTVVWVGLGVVAWLGIAVAAGIPMGLAMRRSDHREAHQNGTVDPVDCQSWCLREHAAALYGTQPRGRHHAPRRSRIDLGRKHHR